LKSYVGDVSLLRDIVLPQSGRFGLERDFMTKKGPSAPRASGLDGRAGWTGQAGQWTTSVDVVQTTLESIDALAVVRSTTQD
jgi:hypothetical protein